MKTASPSTHGLTDLVERVYTFLCALKRIDDRDEFDDELYGEIKSFERELINKGMHISEWGKELYYIEVDYMTGECDAVVSSARLVKLVCQYEASIYGEDYR